MATDLSRSVHVTPKSKFVRHTKVPTVIFETSSELAKYVASVVADLIRKKNEAGVSTILGLPTGSTPLGVYRELIRLHNEEQLDFSNVITFNLDEYWPMDPDSIHSYHKFMHENFFDHVNVKPENIHIPRGDIAAEDVDSFCEEYEHSIEKVGGLDLQLLGIGRSGHIGFNEPGSARNSLTRLVNLDPVTRRDAASGFFGEDNVPHHAITMGVGSILAAKKIIIMALGEHKAPVVKRAAEDEVTDEVSASFLQTHTNSLFAVDSAAAAELTAMKTPWIVGNIEWTPQLEKKAVIWLTREVGKPLLKLETEDFLHNHLHQLIHKHGSVGQIRQRVFDELLEGICTKPAGVDPKRVIVFSPHPDDDVISMGGTLITLADQGHDVYIAYMTSGNIAVFDHDALRHIDFVLEFHKLFHPDDQATLTHLQNLKEDIDSKNAGDLDTPEMLGIKGLIRKTEATAGAEVAGVPEERLRFLNLPFYQTGQVSKKPIGEEDIAIVADLLREINPHQIYVAGDLSDPHGTHRVCAEAVINAVDVVAEEGIAPEFWMYRGAWEEYEPHEIERAVPLSPEVVLRKREAIFKHESQKDSAFYPGSDKREFWVRAEDRTRNTATVYNDLGLPEYFAIEAFKHYHGEL
ncbi:Glucosamine-6-phosphate deaminase 1 [Gimesia alba]|uniref:Glucosamine-6-phosphate deaminase n=1 Tax=Gimesia alba TaxID=2527973 RepID=A0A517REC3_9PLAN|nr:glucosamine-6-phosphate deaminase [Gimesia alba]QDT42232.1 Glucosamine-6-phosphate deaminase 1 [Gimesia alba]